MRVPLFIEFSGRNVLVVGGGGVGTRRAIKFLLAGANVRVLSLEFSNELLRYAEQGKVVLIRSDANDEELLRRNIEWADLVVIATNDPVINGKVRELARNMRKFFNDATNAEETEVVVPFESEINGIRIAVTTEGLSGIVARRTLDKIINILREDEELMNMARVWYAVKSKLKEVVSDVRTRLSLYMELDSDERFNELARKGLIDEALSYVMSKVSSRN
ncbi:precorrin-2 dehydrogenase/sirohydrochlorin ferrochelatase family protein [Vulcanisaeta distributa]|uniref:precorrin-2 dehydrogenase n=1 Tax=Vulcanisaeta distributa (strain DSM 14429 / JCM 11212 / NBRC 100878 / IC-017) TaxID=572478 RepID=E1QNP6_VULDI|nr:bifunctional precorrin-2 dehydrogenase/sirohydrochlorin ferrochelatase [Vulcanisaeta distributa]ADN50142.1 siroheme synthase [Vulcanisaeta distributa DSM 14429]